MGKKPAAKIKDEDEAAKVLADYINKQNRPFNAIDLTANLHDAIGKTVVVRVLANMAERGEIVEKVFGKQKIYFPVQSQYEKMNKEELKAMDVEIDGIKKELSQLDEECNGLQSELASILATPVTDEAEKTLEELRTTNNAKEAKLERLRSSTELVSSKERDAINAKYTTAVKHWRSRRRMAKDILDQILEGYPKSKEQLFEEIGIETDEEVGVNIKDF